MMVPTLVVIVLRLEAFSSVFVHQRKELLELVGFEGRNKYEVLGPDQQNIGFIAERGKSIGAALMRNIFGHWRSLEFAIFDCERQPVGTARHPFRWFFQKLDVTSSRGTPVGSFEQTLSILWKNFKLKDAHGRLVARVSSPPWRIWTFVFKDERGEEFARIEKKWSGLGQELFTDADTFKVVFTRSSIPNDLRNVLVTAAVLIDLQFFESKGNEGGLLQITD